MIAVADMTSEVIHALANKRCWYVSCGGAVGTTFQLALGEKIERTHPVRNSKVSDDFRRFEGEANVLVWCSWRLDDENAPIASWDGPTEESCDSLRQLENQTIQDVSIELPGWDLTILFSNQLTLRIFCDHVSKDGSFDGNWELSTPDRVVIIGSRSKCEVEPRT